MSDQDLVKTLEQYPSFTEYILKYHADDLQTMREHGCVGGIGGMIYYWETTAIYNHYEDDIHAIVADYCDDLGIGFPEYIKENFSAPTSFRNAMVWMAAEIVACSEE